jgi:hypothetical protein
VEDSTRARDEVDTGAVVAAALAVAISVDADAVVVTSGVVAVVSEVLPVAERLLLLRRALLRHSLLCRFALGFHEARRAALLSAGPAFLHPV